MDKSNRQMKQSQEWCAKKINFAKYNINSIDFVRCLLGYQVADVSRREVVNNKLLKEKAKPIRYTLLGE